MIDSADSGSLAALLATAAFLSFILSSLNRRSRARVATRRMRSFVREQVESGTADDERRSFGQRILRPLLATFATPLMALTPRTMIQSTRQRLTHAGLTLGAAEFVGLQFAGGAAGLAVGGYLATREELPSWMRVVLPVLGAVFGYATPGLVVSSAVKRRQSAIRRALAPTLEVLSISIEAGLAFDGAIAHVSQRFQTPLSDELRQMFIEFQMGRTRRQTLQDFAARIGILEVDRFVATIIQGEAMGVPLAKSLQDQAIELRNAQRQRAEALARTAPIKMMFPLVLLTLPALFIVILGPTAIRLLAGALF